MAPTSCRERHCLAVEARGRGFRPHACDDKRAVLDVQRDAGRSDVQTSQCQVKGYGVGGGVSTVTLTVAVAVQRPLVPVRLYTIDGA